MKLKSSTVPKKILNASSLFSSIFKPTNSLFNIQRNSKVEVKNDKNESIIDGALWIRSEMTLHHIVCFFPTKPTNCDAEV